jgi:hypothetical protein
VLAYGGGWDNTGPNNLFYGLMLDPAVSSSYEFVLWMETDVFAIKPNWAARIVEESKFPRGFWRKGPQMLPLFNTVSMVSSHHYHMNTAGLYRLVPCFVDILRKVWEADPIAPPDAMLHAFLHDQENFRNFQRFAHKFHYTDFLQVSEAVIGDFCIVFIYHFLIIVGFFLYFNINNN